MAPRMGMSLFAITVLLRAEVLLTTLLLIGTPLLGCIKTMLFNIILVTGTLNLWLLWTICVAPVRKFTSP